MDRPSFETIYMNLAVSLSARSTCRRLQVGAVIASKDYRRVLAVGYNGNARRFPNDCDSDIPGSCGCLHGESNAIINCAALPSEPKIVFATALPCVMCAKMLINLGGVERLYYLHDYRIRTSLELLAEAEIHVRQFDPEADMSLGEWQSDASK